MKKRSKNNIDIESLKRWKKASTIAKLTWLSDALKFGMHFKKKKSI